MYIYLYIYDINWVDKVTNLWYAELKFELANISVGDNFKIGHFQSLGKKSVFVYYKFW